MLFPTKYLLSRKSENPNLDVFKLMFERFSVTIFMNEAYGYQHQNIQIRFKQISFLKKDYNQPHKRIEDSIFTSTVRISFMLT